MVNGDSTVLFLLIPCMWHGCLEQLLNKSYTGARPTSVSAELSQRNWWCVELDTDHLRQPAYANSRLIRADIYIYMFISD